MSGGHFRSFDLDFARVVRFDSFRSFVRCCCAATAATAVNLHFTTQIGGRVLWVFFSPPGTAAADAQPLRKVRRLTSASLMISAAKLRLGARTA